MESNNEQQVLNNVPKTIEELEHWMMFNCYNFDSYSINGNPINEGYGIKLQNHTYLWYYTERGQRQTVREFSNEHEVVTFAFHQISNNKWAKTHLLGLSTDIKKVEELKSRLSAMKIAYFEDTIPFFELNRPVYRVFVSGCDIRQTEHLRKAYNMTEK